MTRILGILYLIYSFQSFALVRFPDVVYPELATSLRSVAMGNANLSVAGNSEAVFINPAGLARKAPLRFNLGNILFQSNEDFHSIGYKGNPGSYFNNFTKKLSLEGVRQLLLKDKGKYLSSDFQILPNISGTYFSLGFLYVTKNIITMGKAEDAPLEFADRVDYGPFIGFGIPVLKDYFKLGASLTYLTRVESNLESEQDVAINLGDEDYEKGSAPIVLLGATFELPFFPFLKLSAVSHNVFNQAFSQDSLYDLDKIKNQIDVGSSLFVPIGNMAFLLTLDRKDVTNKYSSVPSNRKLLAGLELAFLSWGWLRFGWGDGYPSGGLRIRSSTFEFDISTWGVHGTSREYTREEDRHIGLGFSHFF